MKPRRAQLPRKLRPGWLKRLDGRSRIALALNERLALVAGQYGGLPELTPVQQSLVERWIHLEALSQQFEERMRKGAPDADAVRVYVSVVDRLHGIARTLGLHRKARDVPSLQQYIASKREANE